MTAKPAVLLQLSLTEKVICILMVSWEWMGREGHLHLLLGGKEFTWVDWKNTPDAGKLEREGLAPS